MRCLRDCSGLVVALSTALLAVCRLCLGASQSRYASSYADARLVVLESCGRVAGIPDIGTIRNALIRCAGPLPQAWVPEVTQVWYGNTKSVAMAQIIDAVALCEYGDINLLRAVLLRASDTTVEKRVRVILYNCVLGGCGAADSWVNNTESTETLSKYMSDTDTMLDNAKGKRGIAGSIIFQLITLCAKRSELPPNSEWREAVSTLSQCLRMSNPCSDIDIVDDLMTLADNDEIERIGAFQIGAWLLIDNDMNVTDSFPSRKLVRWEELKLLWSESKDEIRRLGWAAFQAKRLEMTARRIPKSDIIDISKQLNSSNVDIRNAAYRYALARMKCAWNFVTATNSEAWGLQPVARGEEPAVTLREIRSGWDLHVSRVLAHKNESQSQPRK